MFPMHYKTNEIIYLINSYNYPHLDELKCRQRSPVTRSLFLKYFLNFKYFIIHNIVFWYCTSIKFQKSRVPYLFSGGALRGRLKLGLRRARINLAIVRRSVLTRYLHRMSVHNIERRYNWRYIMIIILVFNLFAD